MQEGLSFQQVGERLHIPLRSVARYYARAKELLLDRMYALDEGHITAGIYCPLCGTSSDTDQKDPQTSIRCSGCGAEVEIESDSESTFHVLARQPRRSE